MRHLLLIGAFSLALSCAPRASKMPDPLPLPKEFRGEEGPGTGPPLSWNEYFQDVTLKHLVHQAIEHNLDRRVALQRIELARIAVRRAGGAQLPQLDAVLGAGVRKFGRYTMDGAGNATTDMTPGQLVPENLPNLTVGLQATWEADVWGRLRSARASARARYLATIEGVRFFTTALVADVASAYFELVALDRSLTIVRETLERQEEALEAIRWQKEAGRVNELAVQQFTGQRESTFALEKSILKGIRDYENLMSLLLGRFPKPVTRGAALESPLGFELSSGIPPDLLHNRPDVRQAELELESASCDVKAARAAFFPRLNLTGGAGFEAFNPSYLFTTPESFAYSLGGGIVAPIVNRGAIRADFEAASALQVEAMYAYQSAILRAYIEVDSGLATLIRVREIAEHRRNQRDALGHTVETAEALFRAGKASYLEVLLAQQNVLAAALELINADRTERIAEVHLYRALGGG